MLSFFPRDVLDEIWDLIGSVSEGFPTFFCIKSSFEADFAWSGAGDFSRCCAFYNWSCFLLLFSILLDSNRYA